MCSAQLKVRQGLARRNAARQRQLRISTQFVCMADRPMALEQVVTVVSLPHFNWANRRQIKNPMQASHAAQRDTSQMRNVHVAARGD
jgi:hypothetical protein